ncbi:MAG: 4-(cytidine 5'-diphospho)-2-C-methyl-D-erythritol kinase [Thermogutta sp.]|nr:4-(cytidine 5'-diphospho)-2-C-methyl-D-erythritol kinase [Thermogutta sp.]
MQVRRTESGWEIDAPAKLNLFLEVVRRRPDGYHDIETLVYPIDLFDTLVFRRIPESRIELTVRWATHQAFSRSAMLGHVPSDATNLAYRAVERVHRAAGVSGGLRMDIFKRIPSGAGLGGGSSDAAAALLGACLTWGLNRDLLPLPDWAAELGSDVPAFLQAGPCVCRGRGERVIPVSGPGRWHAVVVRPRFGLSTAEVYRACRPPHQPRNVEDCLNALAGGDRRRLAAGLFNRLQEAAETLVPQLIDLRRRLETEGAWAARMTGSGSCCFGLFPHRASAWAAARRLQADPDFAAVFTVQGCS